VSAETVISWAAPASRKAATSHRWLRGETIAVAAPSGVVLVAGEFWIVIGRSGSK
jgi:hypothetical protein